MKNQRKPAQNLIKNFRFLEVCFKSSFLGFLDRFWEPFWYPNSSKNQFKTSFKNHQKNDDKKVMQETPPHAENRPVVL